MAKHLPRKRHAMILHAAVEYCREPGGWASLTRAAIAKRAGCSESLVSRYLTDMNSIRKSIMRVAIKHEYREIIDVSLAMHDGYAKGK